MNWSKLQLYKFSFENYHYDDMMKKEKNRNETLKSNMKHKKYRLKKKKKQK